MQDSQNSSPVWHGTTILTVRKGGRVVIGGDGQVSIGQTVIKSNAKKVRKLGKGDVIGGFAGATADAFTLFERLESKLEQYPGQLTRAAVELAKDWRTDRYLRRLEAMMIVADKDVSLVLTGTGDVLEPEAGVMAIGSGGNYALAAARALVDTDKVADITDISGRPFLVFKADFPRDKIGEFDTELVREWFQAFAMNAGVTLHVETLYGDNSHHIAESCFKGLARALRTAVAIDPKAAGEIPSTKGSLGG